MFKWTNSRNKSTLANQEGIALMMAIVFVIIMSFLAINISEETQVEYNVSAQAVDRLKAYYAAKAGIEISLLRIKIYKDVVGSLGEQLGGKTHMLDPIWNFPLAWPPSNFIPEGTLTLANKINLQDIEGESMMKSNYMTTISAEDSRLDINDLGSASEGLRKAVRDQLMQIIRYALDQEDSEERFGDFDEYDAEKLLNNIEDWVDENSESLNGGDEKTYYSDVGNDVNSDFLPPNQPFKTVSELHMVADMTDAVYDLIASRVTVYGVKGVNINYADQKMLRSLDPQMTDEVVSEIISRRNDPEIGPFQGEPDFMSFISPLISDPESFNVSNIPLLFDAVFNFRIVSTGVHGRVQKEITAITYDLESIKGRYAKILEEEDKDKTSGAVGDTSQDDAGVQGGQEEGEQDRSGDSGTADSSKGQDKKQVPAGRPTIVYWTEN